MKYSKSESWIRREDHECLNDRISRLDWMATLVPTKTYLTFPGGWMSKHLFEEARYCFVYAQYLASITLGMAYVERNLAALLYGSGRSDLEKANISELLRQALKLDWISKAEFDDIQHAKDLRNRVLHFRKPMGKNVVEQRSISTNEQPYDILEQDARHVLKVMFRLLCRQAV